MPKPEDHIQWMIRTFLPKRIRKPVRDQWKFATAKYVVVSFPKSGRTWLRAALTFYFAERYRLEDPPLLDFANLHYLDHRIPKIYFTHDGVPNGRVQFLSRDKSRYRSKHVLFMARDPRDVSTSLYFHRRKRDLDLDIDLPLYDFAIGPDGGLRTVIEFMNIWADALAELPHCHFLSYEAMHSDAEKTLSDVLRFLGEEPDLGAVKAALERSRFDRLKAMETKGAFASGRLRPGNPDDPDSFKVRRGKVGGYADYFDTEQQRELSSIVDASLSPFYDALVTRASAPEIEPTPGNQRG